MVTQKLINSLKWSAFDKLLFVLIQVLLEIILARLLLPNDYGVFGMVMIVVVFANVLVDGGLSSALIHYRDRSQSDYAVVFYSSVGIGVLSYLFIYCIAPFLSNFFKLDITQYTRIIALSILFNSVGTLSRTKLSIEMDFKKHTYYSLFSLLISGAIAIYLAINEYGVISLVLQLVIYSFLFNLLLVYNGRTIPKPYFTKFSSNRLFGFGSKILSASLLHSVYLSAFPLLLGRFFPASIVGLYTKSNQITTYPAGLLTSTLQRVLYPYLVNFQNDNKRIYQFNLNFLKIFSIIVFPIIIWIIFFADWIIIFIFSERWGDLVLPFKFFVASCALMPIIILNMNIFQIVGKPNIYLYAEITSKIVGILLLFFLFRHGFLYVCIGIFLQSIFQFVITSIIAATILQAEHLEQLLVIGKIASYNLIILVLTFIVQYVFQNQFYEFFAIFVLTCIYGIIISKLYSEEYQFLVQIIRSKISRS